LLHDAEIVACPMIDIQVEAGLLGGEGLSAVHVRDRDHYDL